MGNIHNDFGQTDTFLEVNTGRNNETSSVFLHTLIDLDSNSWAVKNYSNHKIVLSYGDFFRTFPLSRANSKSLSSSSYTAPLVKIYDSNDIFCESLRCFVVVNSKFNISEIHNPDELKALDWEIQIVDYNENQWDTFDEWVLYVVKRFELENSCTLYGEALDFFIVVIPDFYLT